MMRIVLLFFIFTGCVWNQDFPRLPEKPLAITVEGLGSVGYVKDAYTADLERKGYQVINLNWKYKKRLKADVCIVHSCGWMVVKDGADCQKLFSLDARRCDSFVNTGFLKPPGVSLHVSFYQTIPLRGYPIKGAENRNLGATGHISLPAKAKPEILSFL